MIKISQEEIMKQWNCNHTNTPLISIKCMTYNHQEYISQAIDGFLIQKTNFPFEVLIHDDASTDTTIDIIKEYQKYFPKIIKPIFENENQFKYSKHHEKINKVLRGKYIAFCEGDDYWTDPNKLQMQVDFLENNPEYGMCYTKAKQYNQEKGNFLKKLLGERIDSFEDIFVNGNRIPTLTTCIRKNDLFEYINEIKPETKEWLLGDLPMWLWFLHNSKIHFIPKITSVYRVLERSVSHSPDIEKQLDFSKSCYDIRVFFKNKYNYNLSIKWDYNNEYFKIGLQNKNRKQILKIDYKTLSIKRKIIFISAKTKISFNIMLFIIRLYSYLINSVSEY